MEERVNISKTKMEQLVSYAFVVTVLTETFVTNVTLFNA
jgi:hypothetical protein